MCVDNSIKLLEDYTEHVGSKQVLFADVANNSESTLTEINEWINQETHGLIPTLVSESEIPSSTTIALVNALYFRRTWRNPFDPNITETGVFHGVNGDQDISYMTLCGKSSYYREVPELGDVMVELPYMGRTFGLFVFLKNKVDGWKQAEQAYPDYAGKILGIRVLSMKVDELKLPKWKMEFTFEGLQDGLISLGMTDLVSLEKLDHDQLSLSKRHLALYVFVRSAASVQ